VGENIHPVFLILFMIIPLLTVPVSAGAPPADGRPGYLLPNLVPPYINASHGDCLSADETYPAGSGDFRPLPFFFGMSGFHAFMNISCNRSGERYVSEVWYFTDWNDFREQREDLIRYLARHGMISNVTLSLSEEMARTNNTYVAGLRTRSVDAVRYESPETSGYFLIFSTDFFPGPSYYIAYYGIIGPAGPGQHSKELETLIVTAFPGMMESRTYRSNPDTPMAAEPVPVTAGIAIIASTIAIVLRTFQE
jgi:hypothetical protein